MSGWRFSDREWFHNDRLNLRSDDNRRLVAEELVPPNVVFGMHRWFFGGASPSLIAITNIDQWDAEVARGRPGDNIILLSLRQVAHLALVQAGDTTSSRPPTLSPGDHAAIEAYDRAAKDGELLLVRRFASESGDLDADSARIWLRDEGWPWQEQMREAAAPGGEIWVFDGELDWRDHESRQSGEAPPETWTAHHGVFLVDGYLPDEHGRVVCGGAY